MERLGDPPSPVTVVGFTQETPLSFDIATCIILLAPLALYHIA